MKKLIAAAVMASAAFVGAVGLSVNGGHTAPPLRPVPGQSATDAPTFAQIANQP